MRSFIGWKPGNGAWPRRGEGRGQVVRLGADWLEARLGEGGGGRRGGDRWAWPRSDVGVVLGEGGVAGEGARCGGCGRSEGGGGGSHGRETRGEVRGGPVDNRVLGGGPGTLGGGSWGVGGEQDPVSYEGGDSAPWWGAVEDRVRGGPEAPGGDPRVLGGVLRSGGVLGWKGEGGQDPLLSGGEIESMRGS